MHQSFHTSTNAPTHDHIIHTHSNILVNTQTYSHIHNKNSQTHKHNHFNQLTVKIWQVLRLQVDSPSKKAQVVFVIYFAPSTHCKYDFIPFTQLQWASTWKLRICHITLSAVPSKTEHRILYDSVGWTFSQNFSPLALPVWDWEDIFTKGWVTQLINQLINKWRRWL